MEVRTGRCWAEIDRQALVYNLARLPVCASSVMAVVKANAYGHGIEIVAPALLSVGVRSFGTATVEEAMTLRSMPGFGAEDAVDVYVMTSVLAEQAPEVVAHRLIPFVTDIQFARAVSVAAESCGIKANVHIEVDTGIGRAGVACDELRSFYEACRGLSGVSVTGICTHFTSADDPDHGADAAAQFAIFSRALAALPSGDLARLTIHAANSPAIMRLPDCPRGLVRPGLLIYGIGPTVTMEHESAPDFPYRPVMTLKARITLVRRLPARTDISYNRTYRLPADATVATVAIGYGDGFFRRFSNCGVVLLPSGARAPIRGRICMDQFCVEVPEGETVGAGDSVTLFGKAGGSELRISALAELIEATPHELTTCLTSRVVRIPVN